MDDLTEQQLKNGVSYKDTDDVDAESFLDYLERKSSADDNESTTDTQMMSAQDFYNNF